MKVPTSANYFNPEENSAWKNYGFFWDSETGIPHPRFRILIENPKTETVQSLFHSDPSLDLFYHLWWSFQIIIVSRISLQGENAKLGEQLAEFKNEIIEDLGEKNLWIVKDRSQRLLKE